jgi:hypothetical protein
MLSPASRGIISDSSDDVFSACLAVLLLAEDDILESVDAIALLQVRVRLQNAVQEEPDLRRRKGASFPILGLE